MKKWLVAAMCLISAGLAPALAWAEAGLSFEQGWVRAVPPVSTNTAGYFMLHNNTDQDRVLVGVSSGVAEVVEMHTVIEADGASTMQQLKQLVVPQQDCVVFEPGGNHIMFIGLKQPLNTGDKVTVTLTFQGGETLDVALLVQKGPQGQQDMGHGHHHHH
ncbi:MAG: copper chaperone PCu(A)C [Ketobacter sp.]|nr:copper chaperone PCu(A)C [Ketobacter sp.]